MVMKKLTVISLALLSVFFMVSCKGPKGDTGNANVASSTVTVQPNDWYWDNTSWRVDLDYDAIDADIDDYGAVLVYMSNGNTWRLLPFTFYYTDLDEEGNVLYCSSSLEVSTYLRGLSIFWTENDFYDGYRPEEHVFKIVVIASSVYEARSDVDYSNYEAVKEAFQIKEVDEKER